MMKTFLSLFLCLLFVSSIQATDVAEVRRLRALGHGGKHHYGGDNGRDHPQMYPPQTPAAEVEDVSDCVALRVHVLYSTTRSALTKESFLRK